MISIEGFVIVPPLNSWDDKHKDVIYGNVAKRTFGTTEAEAWQKFVGDIRDKPGDLSVRIQHWHDKGYRVKDAGLTIKE